MTTDGRLQRIERGVYIAIPPAREDRPVSNTMLPDGTCKIEVGDDMMTLTMREAKHLAMLISGITLAFAAAAAAASGR
jgi:hypothetical protein